MISLTGDLIKHVLAMFIALVLIVYFFFKRRFKYWENKGVESPQSTIPFGNAKNLVLEQAAFGEEFTNLYHKYKNKGLKYFGFYYLTNPVFIVIDPEFIKTITTTDFQHFTDHVNFIDEEREPLTGNIFKLKGSKWKNLRAKLTPTFTSGKMKMMFQTLIDCSKGLTEVVANTIKNNEALDIKDVASRYTIDIIGSCAFGLDCNSLKNPDSEFRIYGNKYFQSSFSQAIAKVFSFTCPLLLKVFNLTIIDKEVSDFFMKTTKETVDYREKNGIIRKDFMHLLIQLKNNVKVKNEDQVGTLTQSGESTGIGKSLTMNELTAQAFVFFLAGYETSSTTLTFCFYELARNPEIQEKLRREISDVLKKYNSQITYDAIMEMSYMDKCIQETLRKHPPIPILSRLCTLTYKVPDSNITIDKGTLTLIPIYNIQHDSEYYPDPERFDPERFNPEVKEQRQSFTWLPFGEGPRVCIGLRFGLMQTKVALACLLKSYTFTCNSKTQLPIRLNLKRGVLNVTHDLWLDAKKISV